MIAILAEVLAELKNDAEMRGPPGPSGPRGEEGPPGKLPIVKLWTPETVYYAGDVVAYDGGTFRRMPTGCALLPQAATARPSRARHVRPERKLSSSRRRRSQRRQLHRAQGRVWSLPRSRLAADRQPGQARRCWAKWREGRAWGVRPAGRSGIERCDD